MIEAFLSKDSADVSKILTLCSNPSSSQKPLFNVSSRAALKNTDAEPKYDV